MGGTAKGRPAFPRVPVRRDRPSPKRCPLFPRRDPVRPGLGSSPRNDDTDAWLLLQAAGRNPRGSGRADGAARRRAPGGLWAPFAAVSQKTRRSGESVPIAGLYREVSGCWTPVQGERSGWTPVRTTMPGIRAPSPSPANGTRWHPGEPTGCTGNRRVALTPAPHGKTPGARCPGGLRERERADRAGGQGPELPRSRTPVPPFTRQRPIPHADSPRRLPSRFRTSPSSCTASAG